MSKRSGRKILKVFGALLLLVIAGAVAAAYLYWRNMQHTPQYSIALVVDAARTGDEGMFNELVDIDSVVDDFVPQITGKAVELYGRGLPPEILSKAELAAAPFIPAIKEKARAELPKVIKAKTKQLENVPFAALVLGADRYLDIQTDGGLATVKSVRPEDSFTLKMRRDGERWVIVGLTDEQLAQSIAQRIGQELMRLAAAGNDTADGIDGILKRLNGILNENGEEF
jgi:hypothetical protein